MLTVGQGADERQTSPQVVNSVTVEVSVDGARKIALARNVGIAVAVAARLRGEGSAAKDGVTTISSFGGSVSEAVADAAGGRCRRAWRRSRKDRNSRR